MARRVLQRNQKRTRTFWHWRLLPWVKSAFPLLLINVHTFSPDILPLQELKNGTKLNFSVQEVSSDLSGRWSWPPFQTTRATGARRRTRWSWTSPSGSSCASPSWRPWRAAASRWGSGSADCSCTSEGRRNRGPGSPGSPSCARAGWTRIRWAASGEGSHHLEQRE